MRHAARPAALFLFLSLSLFLTLAAGRAGADEAATDGDLKAMQGTWVGTGADGQESRWVFRGDTLKAKVGDMEFTCTITLDPRANPRAIDVLVKEGPEDVVGKTSKGIYKVEDDTLVLCVAPPDVENRPREFKMIEKEAYVFELKKEK